MDLYTLHATLRDALATDIDLDAWAVAQFGKSVTVFSGIPSSGFPTIDDDAPFVALGDPGDVRSQRSRSDGIPYLFTGWIGFKNADSETVIAANVVEPAGVKQIIEAIKLVRNAMVAALPDNVVLDEFKTAADTLGAHDEVNGYFEATFIETLVIGQNPLA